MEAATHGRGGRRDGDVRSARAGRGRERRGTPATREDELLERKNKQTHHFPLTSDSGG
jgi:hypothetical protein